MFECVSFFISHSNLFFCRVFLFFLHNYIGVILLYFDTSANLHNIFHKIESRIRKLVSTSRRLLCVSRLSGRGWGPVTSQGNLLQGPRGGWARTILQDKLLCHDTINQWRFWPGQCPLCRELYCPQSWGLCVRGPGPVVCFLCQSASEPHTTMAGLIL